MKAVILIYYAPFMTLLNYNKLLVFLDNYFFFF